MRVASSANQRPWTPRGVILETQRAARDRTARPGPASADSARPALAGAAPALATCAAIAEPDRKASALKTAPANDLAAIGRTRLRSYAAACRRIFGELRYRAALRDRGSYRAGDNRRPVDHARIQTIVTIARAIRTPLRKRYGLARNIIVYTTKNTENKRRKETVVDCRRKLALQTAGRVEEYAALSRQYAIVPEDAVLKLVQLWTGLVVVASDRAREDIDAAAGTTRKTLTSVSHAWRRGPAAVTRTSACHRDPRDLRHHALRFLRPQPTRSPMLDRLKRRLGRAIALVALLVASPPVPAQFATGGSGAYRNNILWFRWDAHGTSIPQAGATITNSTRVDDQFLRMTCGLSNIVSSGDSPGLIGYRPGTWRGDGLDDLYNIDGTGTANTLTVGLGTRVNGSSASARFSCAATFGPANSNADPAFPIDGLVFADAEQSLAPHEFVAATLSGSGTFRILETFKTADCQTNGTVTVSGSTMTMNGSDPTCASGPVAVGFLDGASSADISLKGGGSSAIALGVMVFVADGGDAPASYGDSHHLPDFRFTGGVPTGADWNYSTNPLAQLAAPLIRLGARVDTETIALSNATASGDDANGTDDEDALSTALTVRIRAAGTHALNVPCSGTAATVYGYIDFNRDGDFLDPNERSAAAACSGASANVTWTMPNAAGLVDGPSFLRLRIGGIASQVSVPGGVAVGGEVEDYPITLLGATISLQKALATSGRRNANDQFVLSIAPAGGVATSQTTTGAGNAVTSAPARLDPAGVGIAHTLMETAAATAPSTDLSRYQTSYQCSNARPGGQAPSGTGRSITLTPALDDELSCTFTNTWTPTVDLSVAKTNAQPFDIRTPGDTDDDHVDVGPTTYTISVWNNGPDDVAGAVVRDLPQAGVTCSGNVACNNVGDAVCPASGSIADLMGGGLVIPRIAASTTSPPQHYVTLRLLCQVE
ncbi:CshA/CshB family fibrillar adhesin-related protein [Lysobacter sp. CA199]|uniref:CshA/CshB family fibrillar adhesin-related protein n=1 Tax=Lysobacter sp. CA199 TaxID=3455608 RepID=UPI003F8D246F